MALDNTPHSPFIQGNIRKPGHTDYPADLLKFNAWKNPVESFDKAISIIVNKRLVLGEPAVVPFNFTHADGTVTLELAFGIGSADPLHPYIKCSITNDIVNEAVIAGEDENGQPIYTTLATIINNLLTKDEADEYIKNGVLNALDDPAITEGVAEAVVRSETLNEIIESHLKWRPISELLNK